MFSTRNLPKNVQLKRMLLHLLDVQNKKIERAQEAISLLTDALDKVYKEEEGL